MNKTPLEKQDFALVEIGLKAFNAKLNHDWHGVVAAARLKSGKVETAFVLECENPILGACAEQSLIEKLLTSLPDDPIETIVAVRQRSKTPHKVIPPCGRCREFITDYAATSNVIIEDGDEIFKVIATDILPFKYVGMP